MSGRSVANDAPATATAATLRRLDEIRELAEGAIDKPATLGPDIDIERFRAVSERERIASLASLERQVAETALMSGFDTDESGRSGSYFQLDRSVIYERVAKAFGGAIEIASTADVLQRRPDELVERWWWRAVAPDKDKYTALVALHQTEGYFIRVKAGRKVEKPIQACLFVSESGVSQNLHNVIVVEDGCGGQRHHGLQHRCRRRRGAARGHLGVLHRARRAPHLHHDPQLGRALLGSPAHRRRRRR